MLAISLPSGYLTGAEDGDDVACWRAMLGTPEQGLATLRHWGVEAVEVGDLRGDVDVTDVHAAFAAIAAAGLRAHAHLWIPPNVTTHGPPATLEHAARLLTSDATAANVGANAGPHAPQAPRGACAVHGYKRHQADALEATVADLAALEPWLRERGLASALEICRYRPEGPLGGTYAEVVALVEAAEQRCGVPLGVTWDLGHTTWNALQGHDRLWPDDAFLRRVAHVHVHDVAASGRTHFPLDEGRVDLAGMIERLRAVGYAGLWDLELYPERWPDVDANARARLEASLACLHEATT